MMNIGGASRTVMIVRSSPPMITSNSFALLLVRTELVKGSPDSYILTGVVAVVPMFIDSMEVFIHDIMLIGDFINEFGGEKIGLLQDLGEFRSVVVDEWH